MFIGCGCGVMSVICIGIIHLVLRKSLKADADVDARENRINSAVVVSELVDDEEADIYSLTSSEYSFLIFFC